MTSARHTTGFGLDTPLILAAKAGDRNAYGRLIKLYQSPLRGFLRRLTNQNHALADDLAQDTMIQAFLQIESYRGDSAFKTWLMSISYRIFLQYVRKDKRRRELLDGYEIPENTTELDSHSHAKMDLDKALMHLSADERTTILLNSQEGMSHDEIAKSINMPLGTVKSHIKRGRDKLKIVLSA